MPYKHNTKLIPEKYDKRVKLSSEDKKLICRLYLTGKYSQRKLAKQFNVSRRTIQFTLNPNKRRANYQNRVANGGSKQYYNKEEHTKAMRKHRQYKQELYINNKLKDK